MTQARTSEIHSALKVFALPSPIEPVEERPSGHHVYLSLDPEFDEKTILRISICDCVFETVYVTPNL